MHACLARVSAEILKIDSNADSHPPPFAPMLNRRASASGGHVGITSPNPSSTRIHRTNESFHGFPTPVPPNAPYNANSTPQQKVVHTLVNRLKNKASEAEQHCLSLYVHPLFQLPVHSGVNLCQVEADEALQQAIETLVDLSHDSVDIIAWAIAELLDKFAKVCDGPLFCPGLSRADPSRISRHRKCKYSGLQNCCNLS